MSETVVESDQVTDAPQEGDAEQAKTFDAEYVDKLRKESAKYRVEAKNNAEAARKLAELENAQKSEADKAKDRLATAESERDTAKAEALRLRTAVTHGISLEDADLFLTGTDEETLTAQAKRLSDRAAEMANAETERKKKHPNVPKEGTSTQTGTTTEEDDRAFARNFFTKGS